MSYTDEFLKELRKKGLTLKKEEDNEDKKQTVTVESAKDEYTRDFIKGLQEYRSKNQPIERLKGSDLLPSTSGDDDDDIAPVRKKEDDKKLDFFQKGAFEDGFDWSDIPAAILGTVGDLGLGVVQGVGNFAEGIVDWGANKVADVYDKIGTNDAKLTAAQLRKTASQSQLGEVLDPADEYLEKYSVAGRTLDAGAQGLGTMLPIVATGGLAGAAGLGKVGATLLTSGVSYLSGKGGGMSEALQSGATVEEAKKYGTAAGAADAVWELVFGGIGKGINAVGFGKGLSSLDDMAAKATSKFLKSQSGKNIVEWAVKSGFEGLEEVGAGFTQAVAKKLTYMDEEEFGKILKDENLLEQFVAGAMTAGMTQAGIVPGMKQGSLIEANKKGVDFVTGYNTDEQTVIDREVEKRIKAEEEEAGKALTTRQKNAIREQVESGLDKGFISVDTIEEVLGGDSYKVFEESVRGFSDNETYKEYLKAVEEEKAIRKEYEELGGLKESTLAQQARFNELHKQIEELKTKSKSGELRAQLEPEVQRINGLLATLRKEVSTKVKDGRLFESYRELQRTTEKFQADVSKYKNEYARKTIQNLIDGGIANNSNEFREFADLLAKASEDKSMVFDVWDNKRIAGTRFEVKGATVNAFVTDDGFVAINKDSKKRLNSLVGHEITHILEGTQFYDELAKAVNEYAATRGEYDTRLKAVTELYAKYKPDADPKKELVADLIGDYIFTDKEFIMKLSTKHRDVFTFVWDQLKYFSKIATAGSKEARQLEHAKKLFADAWRTASKTPGKTQHSIVALEDGKVYVDASRKVINGTTVAEQRKEITNFFSELLDGQESLDIHTIEGDVLTITKADTAGKARDNYRTEKGKRIKMTDEEFAVKLNVEAHIDEIAEVSKPVDKAKDKKAHDFAKDGFTYRRAYFKDFDGQYYEVTLSIGNKGTVATVYNVGKTTESVPPSAKIIAVVGSKPLGGTHPANSISQNSEKSSGKVQHSISDSEGRQLNNDVAEFFKDSAVRDENGNLKVVYHGTSKGGHTMFDTYGKANYGLFGAGTYFTDSKSIAESYTKKGKGSSPQVYETYLNITNPIDMDAEGDATAWQNALPEAQFPESGTNEDFYRAMEEYFEDNEYPRWEAAQTAMEVIEGMGYDGITHIGGGRVNADGERHQVYIAFQPEQIKNVDNAKPTSDPDIRFSLSEAVEETGNLIALHNVTAAKLWDALKLGGLPSPSTAITKSEIAHTNYGDITCILPRSAIDPQADPRNKVYGSDAWTPTSSNARTEYEVNYDEMRSLERKLAELSKSVAGGAFSRDSLLRGMGIEDVSSDNAARIAEKLANYDEVRAAYLAATGQNVEPEYKAKVYGKFGNAPLQTYIDSVGAQHLASVMATTETGDMSAIRAEEAAIRQIIRDNYAQERAASLNKRPELKEQRIDRYMENNVSIFTIEDFVRNAWDFYQEGGAVSEEIDRMATSDKLRNATNTADITAWLEPQVEKILGDPGIYNGKDLFTASGNRRSFAQTHYPFTAENIVKAMQNASARGEATHGANANSIIATATPSYDSIDEIHADEGRLKVEDKETYDNILAEIDDARLSVTHDIMRTTEHHADNQFDEEQILGSIMTEAATGARTEAAVRRAFAKEGYSITPEQANKILALYSKAAQVPTGYFEGKPERVVGFDEVGVFVIPNNVDAKLKQELLNRGYAIAEYDPNVEGDRQKVVNSFEEYKFSLSNVGETTQRGGGYAVYGDRIGIRNPSELGFAPFKDAPAQETAQQTDEDIAPYGEYTPVENTPPDERFAELDGLYEDSRKLEFEAELREGEIERLAKSNNAEPDYANDKFLTWILEEHYEKQKGIEAAQSRLETVPGFEAMTEEEANAQEDRLASLTDEDAPPEVDAPYYGMEEDQSVSDPFEDRDIYSIGKERKRNAFMYDNPEFKPIFQQEAEVLLGELNSAQKGERYYHDSEYYGDESWSGVKRNASEDISYLLDNIPGATYDKIRTALEAIIEDNGKENNALSKKIEIILNDRLRKGYTIWQTDIEVPPNQDYINLIRQYETKATAEEARQSLWDNADQYAPPMEEDIAPVMPQESQTDIAPTAEYEAIRPRREPAAEDDIAPVEYGDKLVRADSPYGKERKWVGTSTESEPVKGKVLPDDLDQEVTHYQPISNKKTLGNANAMLENKGYEASVQYFNSQFANRTVSLDDVALGERLIQEAVKRGDTKTAGELIQNVAILGTELGQKVQALSIIKRLTPEGQLGMLQKTVERGKTKGDKAYEGVEFTQEMIDKILSVYNKDGSYDQKKLNKAVEDVKQQIADQMKVTKMDKVNTWRYLSMLGNPKTHIRNIVSNVAMKGTVAVKNAVARTIETIAPVKNRTKTWQAASDAVKAFAEKTAAEMKDTLMDGGKYSEDASIKQKRQTFKNKILNGIYELNSELLSKEDWWFSRPAFKNAFSEYLTANGIRTEEDIKNNPEIVEKAKVYATEQSQIATFRQYSWLSNKINDIERKNAATQMAVGAVLPFKKTPINIAKTGLNYSPLGFAKTLTYDMSQVKNGKMEASELIDHLSQNITGSALTLVGYMLAQSGLLSGGGEDDKEGDYDYQLGEQTYAVNIGGKSYSLSWLSPVAMPLFVGANAYEQLVEGKEWNGDVVVETLAQTLDPLSEMSFLSGLNQVLSSYDSGIQKFAGIGESMVQNYATQFVPTLSSQIATVTDDTKRTTKVAADSDFRFVDQTINKLKLKIPGLRQTLEPSTDIWGNDVKQTENVLTRAFETFIAPYSTKENIATEIDAEIKSLYRLTGDNGIIPNIPYNYVNYKDVKYEMSAGEHTAFKRAYGQTAYNLMGDLFETSTYQNASAEEQADMVNRVYDYARDEAKRTYLARKGVAFTNATEDGVEVYKEDAIKGAIENDMSLDEYSFYREYPDKYEFLKESGVSYRDYENFDDDAKDAYSWAYKNPDKRPVAKAVAGDYVVYRQYASDLNDIKADKDSSGKSISGSRKEKVLDYINGMDADYGQKIILFKSEYPADDTYNYEIIDYLNSRDDISYEEMNTILVELGFKIGKDGTTIYWD